VERPTLRPGPVKIHRNPSNTEVDRSGLQCLLEFIRVIPALRGLSIGKPNDRNPLALGLTIERLGFRVVVEKSPAELLYACDSSRTIRVRTGRIATPWACGSRCDPECVPGDRIGRRAVDVRAFPRDLSAKASRLRDRGRHASGRHRRMP
jgi:hypothetical protein